MNQKRLHNRWRSSLEGRHADICKLLRRKRALTGPEVHDLRVALRRARLLVELGGKWLGKPVLRDFQAISRNLLKSLNDVRDCDVALDWVVTNGASAALIRRLSARRNRLWLAARRRMKPDALRELKLFPEGKSGPGKLSRRLRKQIVQIAGKCVAIVNRAPEIPVSELHELRRKVRRWRYLRELEVAPRRIRRDRRLKTLIQVQESLGMLQNTDVILDQLKPLRRSKELLALSAALRAGFVQSHREALQEIKQLTSLA